MVRISSALHRRRAIVKAQQAEAALAITEGDRASRRASQSTSTDERHGKDGHARKKLTRKKSDRSSEDKAARHIKPMPEAGTGTSGTGSLLVDKPLSVSIP